MLSIQLEISEGALLELGRQAPFAVATALTRTAVDARDAVRGDMPERFSLRNGWTQRTTHAKPASKESLEAAVAAPDYMDKQEDGGVRAPRSGEHLATPGTRFRKRRITGADTPRGQLERKAFKITLANGHVAIARRRGKKRLPIEILYFLTRTQEFDRRFDFEEQVRESVVENFKVRFAEAWESGIE